MRVPFLMYWKGQLQRGQVYKSPVISLDVAATAVGLAGLPNDPKLDGVNLVPYLQGEKSGAPHESLYWRWLAQSAIRQGKWKYLRGGDRAYLFDVESDREEKRNLLEKHPDIAARLEKELRGWSGELSPPGLATKKTALPWQRYFDHYLDGKPAPKPSATSAGGKLQGWVIRNGRAVFRKGALHVTAKAGKRTAFMAAGRLKLPRKVTAVIKMRTGKAGRGAIAWRESGQKDFVARQSVSFQCAAGEKAVTYRVEVPGQGSIIHVRLLLPAGGADVISVAFEDQKGEVVKSWRFDK